MRLFLSFFILIVLSSFLKKDVSNEINSSLLWEVSNDNNPQKSYIFGTIHLIDSKDFYFPKKIKTIAQESEEFIFELNKLPEYSDILELTKNRNYSTFESYTEKEQELIFDWFESKMNFQRQQVRTLFSTTPPIFISQLITLSQISKNLASYEKELFGIAQSSSKPIVGLETIKEQFDLLNSIPTKIQAKSILESIEKENETLEEFKHLTSIYLKQNIDSIKDFVTSHTSVIELNNDEFIDQRNIKWIPIIEEELNTKKCFIAVGAGHLGGKNGLIQLLKEKNYIVKPINIYE